MRLPNNRAFSKSLVAVISGEASGTNIVSPIRHYHISAINSFALVGRKRTHARRLFIYLGVGCGKTA